MHHLFSSKTSDNTIRGNLNYGGAFGQPSRGTISDGGTKYYPGDADAGLIARAEFYMAVRYDGSESDTADLELAIGNPADGGTPARRLESFTRMALRALRQIPRTSANAIKSFTTITNTTVIRLSIIPSMYGRYSERTRWATCFPTIAKFRLPGAQLALTAAQRRL